MKASSPIVKKAFSVATEAHEGQLDKAGAPYILHPIRVANRCRTDEERVVALLHDVLEDTEITQDELANMFPKHIVEAVCALTKREGENYETFIERVKLNPIARVVKVFDIEDNLDLTRLGRINVSDVERINKYLQARENLI